MEIKSLPIGDIKPYSKNAKQHPEKQIKKIADSIQEFGFNQPIVVDKEGIIVVGHGRYIAAQFLGLEEVPVLSLDVSEEKAKAYRLADNKLNESDWDMDMAIEELKTLSLEMVNLTGFDSNLLLETKEDTPNIGAINVPRTLPGDVYELGNHKLICGDSTDEATYQKLLGAERARLIFTDPPYSIDYHSVDKKSKAQGGKQSNTEKYGDNGGRIMNDNKTPAEALEFYKQILEQLHAFSTKDANIFWWYASRLTDVNLQAFREMGWHFSQIVIWLKNSLIFSPGQLYHRIYEPCMVGWKEGETHFQSFTFTNFTELWNLDMKSFSENLDVIYQKRDKTNSYIHPTQKPVQLAERALKRASEKGDIVLDAFGGSGSTLIACEQLNRRARLIELDPKYCDAIVTRWVQYSEDPMIIKNGKKEQW